MKLKLVNDDGWFSIERAEHDGRFWWEETEYGSRLCRSARLNLTSCVEGDARDMIGLELSIRSRSDFNSKRCALKFAKGCLKAKLYSPRNTDGNDPWVEVADLNDLAEQIHKSLEETVDAN